MTEACRHRPGGGSPLSHLPRPGLWKAGPGQAPATLPGCPRPRFSRSLPRRRPGWREEAGGCRQARRLRGAEARAAMLGPPGRLHPAQAATAPVGRVPYRGGRAAPPATTTPSRCRDRGASRLSAPPPPSFPSGRRQGRGAILGGVGGGKPGRRQSPTAPPAPQVPGSHVRRSAQPAPLASRPTTHRAERGSPGRCPPPALPLLPRSARPPPLPPPPRPPPPPPRPAPGRAPAPPLRADPFPPSCLARAAPLLTPPRGSSPPPPPPHSRLETVGTDAPASRPLPPFGAAAEPASPCRQPGPLLPPPAAPGTGPGKSRRHQTERTTDGRTDRPTYPPTHPGRRGEGPGPAFSVRGSCPPAKTQP